MKHKKRQVVQLLEFAAAMAAALPFYVLPRKPALRLGEWIGDVLYRVMPRRRALGSQNLTIAFGDTLSEAERQQILRATFRNLGKSLVETLHFPKMSQREILAKVSIVGQEQYLAARAKGNGVIFLAAHIGNWEMTPHAQGAAGYPLTVIARPLDNRFLDWVVTKLRTMYGNQVITSIKSLKQVIALLKAQGAIGILTDQNTTRSAGIFVNFFGKLACTSPVIAILALRYQTPVLPAFVVRTGFDTHTLYIGAEVELTRTGEPQADIEVNTARFNRIIEDFIRQYPDQWFWIHNRWKTQPRSEHG